MRIALALFCVFALSAAVADEDFDSERRICYRNGFYDRVPPGLNNTRPPIDPAIKAACEAVEARAQAAHAAAIAAQPANDLKTLQSAVPTPTPTPTP
jgi:hypothetical protein